MHEERLSRRGTHEGRFSAWVREEPFIPENLDSISFQHTRAQNVIAQMVDGYPQVSNSKLYYAITGGHAARLLIEVQGGIPRESQRDIDLIVTTERPGCIPLADNWRNGSYVQSVVFDNQRLVDKHVVKAEVTKKRFIGKDKVYEVYVTGAEFIIISKLTGFGRLPGLKDIEDISGLINNCALDEKKLLDAVEMLLMNIPSPHDASGFGLRGTRLYARAFLPEQIIDLKKKSPEKQTLELTGIARAINPAVFLQEDVRRLPQNC